MVWGGFYFRETFQNILLKQGSHCVFTDYSYPFMDGLSVLDFYFIGLLIDSFEDLALDLFLPQAPTFCLEQWVIFTFDEESC